MSLQLRSRVVGANGQLADNAVITMYASVTDDATGDLSSEYLYGQKKEKKRYNYFVAYDYKINAEGRVVPVIYKLKSSEAKKREETSVINNTSLTTKKKKTTTQLTPKQIDTKEPYYYVGVSEILITPEATAENPYPEQQKMICDEWEFRPVTSSEISTFATRSTTTSPVLKVYTNRVVEDVDLGINAAILPPVLDSTETAFVHDEAMRIAFYFQDCDATQKDWHDPGRILAKIEIAQENALTCDDYVILNCKRINATQDNIYNKYYCDVPIVAFKEKFKMNNNTALKLNMDISVSLAMIARGTRSEGLKEPTWTDNTASTHNAIRYWFERNNDAHSSFGLPITLYPIARPRLTLQYLFSSDEGNLKPKKLDIDLTTNIWGEREQTADLELNGRPGSLLLNGALTFDYAEETDCLSDYTITLTNNALWNAQILEQKNVRGYSKIDDSIITESTYRNAFSYTYQYNFFDEARNGDKNYKFYLRFNTVKGCPCSLRINLTIKGFENNSIGVKPAVVPNNSHIAILQKYLTTEGTLVASVSKPEYVVVTDQAHITSEYWINVQHLRLNSYVYDSHGLALIAKDQVTGQLEREKYYYQGQVTISNTVYDSWAKYEPDVYEPNAQTTESFLLYTKPIVTTVSIPLSEDTTNGPVVFTQDQSLIVAGAFSCVNECSKYIIQCLRKAIQGDDKWILVGEVVGKNTLKANDIQTYKFQDMSCSPYVGYEYAVVVYTSQKEDGRARAHNRYFPCNKIGVLCNDEISLSYCENAEKGIFYKLILPFNIDITNIMRNVSQNTFAPINSVYPMTSSSATAKYRSFNISTTLTRESTLNYDSIIGDSCRPPALLKTQTILSPFILCSTPDDDKYGIIKKASSNNPEELELDPLFQEQVLKMLAHSGTMLFQSPTEGVMIVKITNVTFTPAVATSAKRYDLSFTVTEVAPVTDELLKSHGAQNVIWEPVIVDTHKATSRIKSGTNNGRPKCQQRPIAIIPMDKDSEYRIKHDVHKIKDGIMSLSWQIGPNPSIYKKIPAKASVSEEAKEAWLKKIASEQKELIAGKQFICNIFRTDVDVLFDDTIQPLHSISIVFAQSDLDDRAYGTMTFDDITVPLNRAQHYWFELSLLDIQNDGNKDVYTTTLLYREVYTTPPITAIDMCLLCARDTMLKLQYDLECNNISSQKNELIVSTLGGEYPFYAKAGKTNYRTFSLSALLSCQLEMESDPWLAEDIHRWDSTALNPDSSELTKEKAFEHSMFIRADLAQKTSQILDPQQYNHLANADKQIVYENYYRQKVLDFLYQDAPLLLRSPVFGNIFIKLHNISCTPKAELGRQIYTFSAEAVEVLETSASNYARYFYDLPSQYIISDGMTTIVAGATQYTGDGPLDVTTWSEDYLISDSEGEKKTISQAGGWSALLAQQLRAHNTFIHVGDIVLQEISEQKIERDLLSLNSAIMLDPVWGDAPILHPTNITNTEDTALKTSTTNISIPQNKYTNVRLYQIPKMPKGV